jgi:predicted adenine nucleotide alpha hydrolase (AANH) superfamily ATPase
MNPKADLNRDPLPWPYGQRKVLLHACCAPCSGEIIEAMLASDIDLAVFFYNPNIHPRAEYARRKEEIIRFVDELGVPFVDGDYDRDAWLARTRGLEHEPERGRRCTLCFEMRLEHTARHAHAQGFPVIATSLGISRWKDQQQVNDCGHRAAAGYPGLA